jgi:REP element-mobilizing transposase RayT
MDEEDKHDSLHRLPPGAYRGRAVVHWSMTMDDRQTGRLTPAFAQTFRELLLHSCGRYGALCPVYCLMPDHLHLLLHGWRADADQRLLIAHLRRHVNARLPAGCALQKQPYDHVLRDEEKGRDGFRAVAFYIANNPVRAKLAREWAEYAFTDSVVPGYPELHVQNTDFWERHWRVHAYLREGERGGKTAK